MKNKHITNVFLMKKDAFPGKKVSFRNNAPKPGCPSGAAGRFRLFMLWSSLSGKPVVKREQNHPKIKKISRNLSKY